MARIAAQWNPPGVVEKLLPFTVNWAVWVLTQLLETWGRLGDYEEYARDVLSQFDFSRFCVELQNWRRIERIGHFQTITNLVLRNDVRDLGPVADLPHLRRLMLRDNPVTSLSRLVAARSPQVVVLENCSSLGNCSPFDEVGPVDLAPPGKLELRRLVVIGLRTRVNLASLAGARLFSLRLSGGALHGSPPVLPPGLQVQHLSLTGGARRIRLAGVRGLRSVIMGWAPTDEELAELAGLPELRRLVVWRVPYGTPKPHLPGVDVTVCWSPADGR